MAIFRDKASVHQLHAPAAEIVQEGKLLSIVPLLEREAESAKPYSRFYYTDLIGRFNKWRGKPVQDAQPNIPNYNLRRTIVESPLILAGLAGAIALASITYNSISDDGSSNTSGFLAPRFEVVSGSEAAENRITRVNVSAGEATYYEEKGNVLCRFSGIEVHNATSGSSTSDVIMYTRGNNSELDYGSDCYDSATIYVNYLNPQGFNYTVHDPETFDSNIPNELRFPSEVQILAQQSD